MKWNQIAQGIFYTLFVAASAQAVYYYGILPEKLATHFDLHGNPDGYGSKLEFIIFYFALLLFYVLFFEIIEWIIGKSAMERWISLPHKDYWLAEERRGETIRDLTLFIRSIGIFILLFFLVLARETFRVNLHQQAQLGWFIWLVFPAILISMIALYLRFGSVKNGG